MLTALPAHTTPSPNPHPYMKALSVADRLGMLGLGLRLGARIAVKGKFVRGWVLEVPTDTDSSI